MFGEESVFMFLWKFERCLNVLTRTDLDDVSVLEFYVILPVFHDEVIQFDLVNVRQVEHASRETRIEDAYEFELLRTVLDDVLELLVGHFFVGWKDDGFVIVGNVSEPVSRKGEYFDLVRIVFQEILEFRHEITLTESMFHEDARELVVDDDVSVFEVRTVAFGIVDAVFQ